MIQETKFFFFLFHFLCYKRVLFLLIINRFMLISAQNRRKKECPSEYICLLVYCVFLVLMELYCRLSVGQKKGIYSTFDQSRMRRTLMNNSLHILFSSFLRFFSPSPLFFLLLLTYEKENIREEKILS